MSTRNFFFTKFNKLNVTLAQELLCSLDYRTAYLKVLVVLAHENANYEFGGMLENHFGAVYAESSEYANAYKCMLSACQIADLSMKDYVSKIILEPKNCLYSNVVGDDGSATSWQSMTVLAENTTRVQARVYDQAKKLEQIDALIARTKELNVQVPEAVSVLRKETELKLKRAKEAIVYIDAGVPAVYGQPVPSLLLEHEGGFTGRGALPRQFRAIGQNGENSVTQLPDIVMAPTRHFNHCELAWEIWANVINPSEKGQDSRKQKPLRFYTLADRFDRFCYSSLESVVGRNEALLNCVFVSEVKWFVPKEKNIFAVFRRRAAIKLIADMKLRALKKALFIDVPECGIRLLRAISVDEVDGSSIVLQVSVDEEAKPGVNIQANAVLPDTLSGSIAKLAPNRLITTGDKQLFISAREKTMLDQGYKLCVMRDASGNDYPRQFERLDSRALAAIAPALEIFHDYPHKLESRLLYVGESPKDGAWVILKPEHYPSNVFWLIKRPLETNHALEAWVEPVNMSDVLS